MTRLRFHPARRVFRSILRNAHRQTAQRGSGVIGTLLGTCAFLGFLLLATHALLGLYAASIVATSTWDTAKAIAISDDPASTEQTAAQAAHRQLSGFRNVHITSSLSEDAAVVTIRAQRPNVLASGMRSQSQATTITRTARVHREREQ